MLTGPTDLTTEKQSIESNDAAEEGDRFFLHESWLPLPERNAEASKW